MTRDEIRDIIARTLCPKPWDKTGPEAHAAYKKVADVILEALEAAGLCIAPKEPTEAMVNIGEDMLHAYPVDAQ